VVPVRDLVMEDVTPNSISRSAGLQAALASGRLNRSVRHAI
jgi:hypothetical protein